MRARADIAPVLAALLVSACAADDVALSEAEVCFESAECGGGAVCRQGLCVPTAGAAQSLDVEVRPAGRSAYLPTRFPDARVTEDGRVALELVAPVAYDTVVLDPEGQPTGADLLFRPEAATGGRPLDVAFRVGANRETQLLLTPGTYEVVMSPLDLELPPRALVGFEVEPGVASRRKELVLPQSYRVLSGAVRDRVSNALRIPGARITAVGMESGLASTEAISDANGEYTLLLPETPETTFRLEAVLPDALQPAWDFEQVIRVGSDGNREKIIDVSVPSEVVRGAITLELIGLGDRGPVPVSDARVTLSSTSTLDMTSRAFRVVGRTGEDGRLRVEDADVVPLLRGRYRAVIEPPPASPFARAEEVLALDSVGHNVTEDHQITLSPRPMVRGRVIAALGEGAAFARVVFEPVGDAERRAPDAVTDAEGGFEARLDPGPYLLVVEPRPEAPGAPAPSAALPVNVPAVGPLRVPDIVLPPGRLVQGELRGEDGRPVVDAEISVFERLGGARYEAARARTDDRGRFVLVLSD